MLKISKRLCTAAQYVRSGAVVADIGTDHAYLPIFLLKSGKISYAVCSDINEGPLRSARENAREAGIFENIDFTLADGADALADRELSDIAICGMGGELIADIIDRAPHLKDENINLILQPMTKQEKLRAYLASAGFGITHESYSFDSGKYYVCLLASFNGKCREISEIESIAGSPHTKYLGVEYREKYLKKKLDSLVRASEGKKDAGIDCKADEELISSLKELILKGN